MNGGIILEKDYLIGVDINSEKVSVGLVDLNGKVIKEIIRSINYNKGKSKLIEDIADSINKVKKGHIIGVGVGSPGIVDHKKGSILKMSYKSSWNNINMKSLLQKKVGSIVYLDTNANCYALAEYKCGVGRGYQNILFLVLNSTINAGLVVNGKLYKGNCTAAGVKSESALYHPDFATFEGDEVYNQADAEGFIRLSGLRLRISRMLGRSGK